MLNIRKLAYDHGLKQEDLADLLSCSQSVISTYYNAGRPISRKHMQMLVSRFGKELLDRYDISSEEFYAQPRYNIRTGNVGGNVVAGNNNRVGWSDQKHEDVETIEEDALVISEPVIVPPAIMQRPDTDSKEWVESREAQANADRLQISSILKATDMVWRIEDEAMRPTLFMGEYVLIKEMDDNAQVVDGRVYAIDTKYHGNLIRRVYDEGDSYRLDPVNRDGYSSVVVNKENGFNRRYRILCHLSTEISILPDVDEERKRQDRLIEEVGKAGSRVDRLIDMLEKKC